METKKFIRELLLITVHIIPFAYLWTVWDSLPDQVATHFNFSGEPDQWNSKNSLIWMLLALNGIVYLLFLVLPKLAAKSYLRSGSSVMIKIRIIFTLLIGGLSFFMVYMADGDPKNGILGLGVLFSLLCIFLGNYLQTVKPNYLVGIRTPWTLESEPVWRKTHQLGGKLMFFGGLLSLPLIFIVPSNLAPFPAVIPLVGSMIFSLVYSYLLFQKEKKKESV